MSCSTRWRKKRCSSELEKTMILVTTSRGQKLDHIWGAPKARSTMQLPVCVPVSLGSVFHCIRCCLPPLCSPAVTPAPRLRSAALLRLVVVACLFCPASLVHQSVSRAMLFSSTCPTKWSSIQACKSEATRSAWCLLGHRGPGIIPVSTLKRCLRGGAPSMSKTTVAANIQFHV